MGSNRFLVVVIAMTVMLTSSGGAQSSRLLVLNKTEATFVIVDPGSGKTLARIPTGDGPHELAVSDDGKFAFATNYGTGPAPGHTISMFDIAAQKELRRIDVAPLTRPHGIAVVNGKVYFTAEADKKIARYDPATNNIDWLFETGQNATHMIYVTRDARTIFTANIASDSISIIQQQASDNAWTHTVVTVGKGPEGLDLSPNGRELWTAHSRDGAVSVIDVPSRKVIHNINIGTKRSNRIKLTPDGKYALVSDLEAGEVVVIDAAARKEIKRLAIGPMAEGIVIPDNSRAFVAINGADYVAVLDLKTWAVTRKLVTGKGPDGMAWLK
jgi:YVTN family beta-propeller protein